MKLLDILEGKVVAGFRDRILIPRTPREIERVGNASKTWGPGHPVNIIATSHKQCACYGLAFYNNL